ncbi:MAG: sugar 3,4-ketoisomerase [Solirubrobacterales bacterium]
MSSIGTRAGSDGNERRRAARVEPPSELATEPKRLGVTGVTLHRLVRATDPRGTLVAAEVNGHVPFRPLRVFSVMHVPSKDLRGAHAHRRCKQFLICLVGSITVAVDDGRVLEEVALEDPSLGLYLPPMTWGIQYRYSADALLLVLASRPYEPADYIHDYDEFLALVGGRGREDD